MHCKVHIAAQADQHVCVQVAGSSCVKTPHAPALSITILEPPAELRNYSALQRHMQAGSRLSTSRSISRSGPSCALAAARRKQLTRLGRHQVPGRIHVAGLRRRASSCSCHAALTRSHNLALPTTPTRPGTSREARPHPRRARRAHLRLRAADGEAQRVRAAQVGVRQERAPRAVHRLQQRRVLVARGALRGGQRPRLHAPEAKQR